MQQHLGAAARLWAPLALTALFVLFTARMHGGIAFMPLAAGFGCLLGVVESRVLAGRGHAREGHGALLVLGAVAGAWMALTVDDALVTYAKGHYEGAGMAWWWNPVRAAWWRSVIESGLGAAAAFWLTLALCQWLALRRQLVGPGRWLSANLAGGLLAHAGVVSLLSQLRPARMAAGLALLTLAALVLAAAVARLPVVPAPAAPARA